MARRALRAFSPLQFLAGIPLFKRLDGATRARIAERISEVQLRRGETLFRRGERPQGCFIVVFGAIALFAPARRGPRLSGIVGPGRSFGEPIMFLDKPYLVDARAQSDALLLHVPKDAVFAEIERSPAFARQMIAGLATRVEALVGELERQSGTARERLIAYLLREAATDRGAAAIVLRTSKTALASQLGLTAEHLSRLLRELAAGGLVRVEGRRILIDDTHALAAHGSRRAAATEAGDEAVGTPVGTTSASH